MSIETRFGIPSPWVENRAMMNSEGLRNPVPLHL